MATSIPPTLESYVFDNEQYTSVNLRIPKGSLEAYLAEEGWKEFKNIEEYNYVPNSIQPVLIQHEADATAPIYDLQGMQMKNVESLPTGIYIQGGKKFIVK